MEIAFPPLRNAPLLVPPRETFSCTSTATCPSSARGRARGHGRQTDIFQSMSRAERSLQWILFGIFTLSTPLAHTTTTTTTTLTHVQVTFHTNPSYRFCLRSTMCRKMVTWGVHFLEPSIRGTAFLPRFRLAFLRATLCSARVWVTGTSPTAASALYSLQTR